MIPKYTKTDELLIKQVNLEVARDEVTFQIHKGFFKKQKWYILFLK